MSLYLCGVWNDENVVYEKKKRKTWAQVHIEICSQITRLKSCDKPTLIHIMHKRQ